MYRLLSGEGYEVSQASTGDEAIQMLGEQKFDLVLSDRRMPGADGVSLLNHIRTNYPNIPVAIVTAYPEGMEDLKPDALLVKPFGSQELTELVRRLTEEHSA
jgi:CheY-like chemotaxis protein